VETSTLTIIKYMLFGFIIGMVVAVMQVSGKGADRGTLVFSILGAVIGATSVMGVIGYFKTRNLPPDQAITPMSTGRKVTLYVSLGFLGLMIGGVALLLLLR
jgi:hypothetical protein